MLVQVPQAMPGLGEVGVEAYRLLESRACVAVLSLGAMGTAQAVPGARHPSVQAQGLAKGRDRLGRAGLVLKQYRQVVPGERVVGAEPHELSGRGERSPPGPGHAVEREELAPDLGQLGPPGGQLSVGGDRLLRAAFEPARMAQAVEPYLRWGEARERLEFRRRERGPRLIELHGRLHSRLSRPKARP